MAMGKYENSLQWLMERLGCPNEFVHVCCWCILGRSIDVLKHKTSGSNWFINSSHTLSSGLSDVWWKFLQDESNDVIERNGEPTVSNWKFNKYVANYQPHELLIISNVLKWNSNLCSAKNFNQF